PINTHLSIEYTTFIYFVPFQNTLTIRKLDTSDGTSSLIVTEVGTITKFYYDSANAKLYYYQTQSIVSYVDLTDDSITDLNGTLDAVEDIFVYSGDPFAVDTSEDDLTYYKYTIGSGYYLGTYSFTDDADGSDPAGWVLTEITGTVNVISDLDGHSKVMEIDDTGASVMHAVQEFGIDHNTDGDTIEFWWRSNDVTKSCSIRIYDTLTETKVSAYINLDNGQFRYATGSWNNVKAAVVNTWYHHKLVFNFTASTYDWYIDDILEEASIPFNGTATKIRELYITTSGGDANYKQYFDAFGYSWDANFNVGDNLVEAKTWNAVGTIAEGATNFFDIGALGNNDNPIGICWDGTNFFVVDNTDAVVYKYNAALDTEVATYDIGALGDNDSPIAITWDGTSFYVTDAINAYV
ncbi:hypothetical protein LCGC14_2812240, partial [marine sediment metagenome]